MSKVECRLCGSDVSDSNEKLTNKEYIDLIMKVQICFDIQINKKEKSKFCHLCFLYVNTTFEMRIKFQTHDSKLLGDYFKKFLSTIHPSISMTQNSFLSNLNLINKSKIANRGAIKTYLRSHKSGSIQLHSISESNINNFRKIEKKANVVTSISDDNASQIKTENMDSNIKENLQPDEPFLSKNKKIVKKIHFIPMHKQQSQKLKEELTPLVDYTDRLYNSDVDPLNLLDMELEIVSHVCASCNKVFFSTLQLKRHQKYWHEATIKCSECPAVFKIVEDFVNHKVSEHLGKNKKSTYLGNKTINNIRQKTKIYKKKPKNSKKIFLPRTKTVRIIISDQES